MVRAPFGGIADAVRGTPSFIKRIGDETPMKKLVALVMMAFLVPAAAYAKNPCKDDKVKFCADAKKAGTKVNDCLRQHENEISAACKEHLSKPKEGKPNKTEKK